LSMDSAAKCRSVINSQRSIARTLKQEANEAAAEADALAQALQPLKENLNRDNSQAVAAESDAKVAEPKKRAMMVKQEWYDNVTKLMANLGGVCVRQAAAADKVSF